MTDCVIYGAGGHGNVVRNILMEEGTYQPVMRSPSVLIKVIS